MWRKSPKFQNGMNFPVVAPCPQFSQTVGPPVDELCPLSPLTRAGSRGGEQGAAVRCSLALGAAVRCSLAHPSSPSPSVTVLWGM